MITTPAGGEAFEQLDLGRAGVLELIDQQMADAVVEAQAELRGIEFVAQRGDSARCQLAEIHLAAFAKHQPQLGGGELHQARQRAHHVVVVVIRRRQLAQALQGRDRPGVERRECCQHRILLRLEFFACREAVVHGHRLARLVLLRQQQVGQCAPAR